MILATWASLRTSFNHQPERRISISISVFAFAHQYNFFGVKDLTAEWIDQVFVITRIARAQMGQDFVYRQRSFFVKDRGEGNRF